MMKCVFCGREHEHWRNGLSLGGICPRCWADIYRAQRNKRRQYSYTGGYGRL